ncbi:hypothetical protein M422DRAFT_242950 [Sphaerobolus stellatus SS14]|nr:hypothetical protein M422DRAFT_242950 [Sphaerobolus stellatus SS14]
MSSRPRGEFWLHLTISIFLLSLSDGFDEVSKVKAHHQAKEPLKNIDISFTIKSRPFALELSPRRSLVSSLQG